MHSVTNMHLSTSRVYCSSALSTSQVSWKYARPTSANTSQPSFGPIDYISNAKWLLHLAFRPLLKEIENWPEVLRYYLLRETRDPVAIQFRNGEVLRAPRDYNFGAIAETLLVDSYRFNPYSAVTVDIGASIGDFALLASRHKSNRVYAYEKDPGYYRYLRENMSLNHRNEVRTFNASANRHTLTSIIGDWESKIDFLKVDCEGCEYDLLMQCPREVLSRVSTIAVEVHERPPYSKASLIAHLKGSGFQVFEDKRFGRGHHVHAARKLLVSG